MSEEHIADSGVITAIQGNAVKVEIQRGGGCRSCAMRGFCFSHNTPAVFHLISELPLKVGDKVELEVSGHGRVMASLLIFGLPVFALLLGYILASLWLVELASILLAFMAMALSFLVLKLCDKRLGTKIKIEIARKIEDTIE